MRTIILIILAVIVIAGGIFLYNYTDKFTNFDKIFDKIYEQVDKNIPDTTLLPIIINNK